jgi:orotidine-5'-phosphate decarboxylase
MQSFGHRLRNALDARGPLCVGIDPHPALLDAWGLDDDPGGLGTFTMTVVEALADRVAVLKPQSAFFERHGSAGIAVLEQAVAGIRAAGALALLDVKRGDIGSTMQGYADAYLAPRAPVRADAITVSPFLGFGSLAPALATAEANGAGLFVLALTSNPEGREVQAAHTATGTVAGEVIAAVRAHNAGARPMGSVGLVVGANLDGTDEDLDVDGPILAPGFGAQGGTGPHLATLFSKVRDRVLPSTSRDVLAAGPAVAGLRSAAARSVDEASAALR